MRHETEIRQALIENTIGLIAEGGFEKATTRSITYRGEASTGIRLNEVYIYRLFGSKEELYAEAFRRLDNELIDALCVAVKSAGEWSEDLVDQLYAVFHGAWRFLLGNEKRCRCYVRFYYSVYFKGAALLTHRRSFGAIVNAFRPLFIEEADVGAIMHSILTTIMDFAIRVYNGDLEDTPQNELHVFNVVYCTMMTYLSMEGAVSKRPFVPQVFHETMKEARQ